MGDECGAHHSRNVKFTLLVRMVTGHCVVYDYYNVAVRYVVVNRGSCIYVGMILCGRNFCGPSRGYSALKSMVRLSFYFVILPIIIIICNPSIVSHGDFAIIR